MALMKQIAQHFRQVHFGGNWTDVNLKDSLADLSWQEAITQLPTLNTIAQLVFHSNYYVSAVLKRLQGEPLNASDKFSFDLSPITSAEDWQKLVKKVLEEAELFAHQVEKMDEAKLLEDFAGSQYGNYYRNLLGIIEHTHYHLGQIVLIKKIIRQSKNSTLK